jgi:hypothetical protein
LSCNLNFLTNTQGSSGSALKPLFLKMLIPEKCRILQLAH